jgi:hypothetical protein
MAVVGLAGLAMLSSAWAEAPGKGPAHTSWAKSDSYKGGAKYHGRKSGCRGGYYKRGPHGPDYLAKKLSVMETEIGIRANQLDAWRDYTDARLAMIKPPSPPERPAPPSEGTPDAESQPFGHAESFAKRAISRGQSGQALVQAIETLRSTLTPEQLAKVEAIEAKAGPWRHHGRKPSFCQHRGKGPHGGGHRAGPRHGPKPSDN